MTGGRFQRCGVGPPLLVLTVILAPWDFVRRLFEPPGTDVTDPVIGMSAFGAVMYWAFGVNCAIENYRPGRVEPRPWFRQRRWVWTAGCAFVWLHMALAMHAGHGWSHASAYRHTEEISGFGAGVYVNYLFGLVWLADVLWMWAAPDAYRRRPRWVGYAVHGFLAFIVFNATVVFGRDPFARGVAILFAAGLGWQLVRKWYPGPAARAHAGRLG